MSSSKAKQKETFADPNAEIVPETPPGGDAQDTELHNKEVTRARPPGGGPVIRQVFTSIDEDPEPENISEEQKKKIANFTQAEYDAEVKKEELARLGWCAWQSKQLFYYAYRQVGYVEKDKVMEWEERGYTYHQIPDAQKLEIRKKQGQLETLRSKNNLFRAGVLNDFLYREIFTMAVPIDQRIYELEDELVKLKFKAYFQEQDDKILGEIQFVDLRDLVEAAEYRETQIPFSRKRDSWRSTSSSSQAKIKSK